MTLQAKIILLLITTIIVISTASLILTDKIMRNAFESELTDKSIILVQTLAESIGKEVIDNDVLEVREVLNKIVQRTKNLEYSYVIGLDGKIFAHTFRKGFPKALLGGAHHEPQEFPVIKKYALQDKPILDVGFPLIRGMQAHIHIGMDESMQQNRYALLRKQTLYLSAIFIFFGILLSFFLSRKIIHPMRKLSEYVNDYGVGKLKGTIKIDSKAPEIKLLCNSFNKMIFRREAAEEMLKESELKYRTLFESSTDAIAILDTDTGKYIDCNSAAIKLHDAGTRENFLKFSPEQLSPKCQPNGERSNVQAKEHAKQALTHGSAVFEWSHSKRDGSQFPVLVSFSAIQLAGKKFLLVISRDISEQKRMEADLLQAHKMEAIGTLSGGIAHDFNNILAAILGYADMAKDDTPDTSPAKYQIEQVLKAGNRAKELIKHILSYSRKNTQKRVVVKVSDIALDALKLLRASIPSTIKIKHSIDQACGNILADPTQIHQVLMNLCTNAAQSMDESGGTLQVDLAATDLQAHDLTSDPNLNPGRYICMTVKDNGIGIDRKNLNKIFDPYFTTKKIGKGSGMGLAVVIGIVKSHEGMISVDSTPGSGTTFRVFFPAIQESIHTSTEMATPLPTGNERILLVDDEESMVDMTSLRLKRLGYKVTATTSSMEALQLFKSQPDEFDLIFTDQTMPELTGEKLSKKILTIRPEMPIIICSGYSARMDAQKAKTTGIAAFIMKPIDIKALAETIRKALQNRPDQ